MNWAALESVSTAVGALVVIIAAFYARYQLAEVRADRNAELLRSFQERWHGPEFRSFRNRLLGCDFGNPDDFDAENLHGPDSLTYWRMLDDWEFIGFLVDRKLLDFELVVGAFRSSPPRIWIHVKSDVMRRRRKNPPPIQFQYLEKLAERYNEHFLKTYGLTHPGFRDEEQRKSGEAKN